MFWVVFQGIVCLTANWKWEPIEAVYEQIYRLVIGVLRAYYSFFHTNFWFYLHSKFCDPTSAYKIGWLMNLLVDALSCCFSGAHTKYWNIFQSSRSDGLVNVYGLETLSSFKLYQENSQLLVVKPGEYNIFQASQRQRIGYDISAEYPVQHKYVIMFH